jgi:hypothetical protein
MYGPTAITVTLQLPFIQLKRILLEEYDEEIRRSYGFKWRYATSGRQSHNDLSSKEVSQEGKGKPGSNSWMSCQIQMSCITTRTEQATRFIGLTVSTGWRCHMVQATSNLADDGIVRGKIFDRFKLVASYS